MVQALKQVILFARVKLAARCGQVKEVDAIMAFRKRRKQDGLSIFNSN